VEILTSGPILAGGSFPWPQDLTAGCRAVPHEPAACHPAGKSASCAPISGKVLEDLALIQKQAYRCKTITRSLLDFARQGELRLAEADANALVRQTVDLLAAGTRGARPGISTRLDQALPFIVTDQAQLQQVLVNVLKNALDATEAGGDVEAVTAGEGDGVAIAIRDGGCGIPPEHLPKIFDPFFTTKPAGVGTGLGLAITYRIREVLGGTIAVESRPGHGTTVRMALPRVPAVPAIRPDGHRSGTFVSC
jgi:two-component system NtrC family sensor kinase